MEIIIVAFVLGFIFTIIATICIVAQKIKASMVPLLISYLFYCGAAFALGCNLGIDSVVQVNMEQVPVKGSVTISIHETVTFKDGKRIEIKSISQKVVGK
jgi:hypothetical protein